MNILKRFKKTVNQFYGSSGQPASQLIPDLKKIAMGGGWMAGCVGGNFFDIW